MTTEIQASADPAFGDLAHKAAEATRLLRLLANENRMLVLCRMASQGEATVSELAEAIGLSQSALSQHLALMRQDGLVSARRDGLQMHYSIADPIAEQLLGALKTIYCPPQPRRRKN